MVALSQCVPGIHVRLMGCAVCPVLTIVRVVDGQIVLRDAAGRRTLTDPERLELVP